MIRLGIGISVSNIEDLKCLVESIEKYTTQIPHYLMCAIDGFHTPTIEYLTKKGIEFVAGPSVGQSLNLNRIFKHYIHHNYTLILKDNIEILAEGWAEEFIASAGLFNMPHLIYNGSNENQEYLSEQKVGEHILRWTTVYDPVISFYYRKAIEKVGGIDSRFYGDNPLGQEEQYARMVESRLMMSKPGFPNLQSLKKFAIIYPKKPITTTEHKEVLDSTITEFKQTNNLFRKL